MIRTLKTTSMKPSSFPMKLHAALAIASLLLLSFTNLEAQPVCANPNTLFGIDGSGNLYKIDPTTGVVSAAINTVSYTAAASYTTVVAGQTSSPSSPNALGYNNVNGKFYYFKRDPGGGGSQFVSYDPVLNRYTTLAAQPFGTTVHAGCVSFSGNGYYCLDVNSNLWYYNILLNTWSAITGAFTDQFANNVTTIIKSMSTGDMAIDGLGNLWILPSNGTNLALYKMNAPLPVSPVASVTLQQILPPTKPTPSGVSIFGVGFDPSGNLFMSTSGGQLYKMSTAGSTPVLVGSLTTGGMTDLSSCSFPFTILPLQWTSFSATMQGNGSVLLNWIVAQSTGNKEFNIERSQDGVNWVPLGTILISNSSAYAFTDFQPGAAMNYYRIRQVNDDGSGSYSPAKLVNFKTNATVSCWPNPVSNIIFIQVPINTPNGNGNYAMLFDAAGRVLLKTILQRGTNSIALDKMPAGNFELTIHLQNGELQSREIVKR